MTSKLICPVCGAGKVLAFPDGTFACDSEYCKSYEETDTTAYNLLIQAKQDLEIARKALEDIRDETGEDRAGFSYVVLAINMKETAEKALEQIEHKE